MNVTAKIFNCNWETYRKVYLDAVKRAYAKDDILIEDSEIGVEIDYLEGDTVQSMRAPNGRHSRTISVYDEYGLRYIIGFSNTGYDEDKRIEAERTGGKYQYGNNDFHSNTYMCQGINKIFEYYFTCKRNNPSVRLFFYLLDVDSKSYPDNLSNNMTYRKLATLGFDVLNIEKISFSQYRSLGFISIDEYKNIGYSSFNKFANDVAYISSRNSGNIPSYLQCVNNEYRVDKQHDSDYDLENPHSSNANKYIYTFKALGAQSYDSFLTMWVLSVLAERERKNLEFRFSSERYSFRKGQAEPKATEDFPDTIVRLFNIIGLDIKYEACNDILQQFNREKTQYEIARKNQIIRNQELFRNNLRAKGVPVKCSLCGCEIEKILEAAHIWGVSEIKNADTAIIDGMYRSINNDMPIRDSSVEDDFYKRYTLANSGDNGIWLCRNHHGLFDSDYYSFSSCDGNVFYKNIVDEEDTAFISLITTDSGLSRTILTPNTLQFIKQRNSGFAA